ncbi:Single-stranded TG1-3 DNA-binding protein [Schizosaccharomyces pombe]
MSAEETVTQNAPNTVQDQVEASVDAAVHASAEQSNTPAQQADDFRVFVGRLSTSTKKSEIRSLFETVGTVRKVTIPFRRVRRGTRLVPSGIAFVTFNNQEDVDKAIETLNGKTLDDREIVVQKARPVQEQPIKDRKKSKNKNGEEPETSTSVENAESAKGSSDENEANTATAPSSNEANGVDKKQNEIKGKGGSGKNKAKPLPPNSIYVSGLSVTLTNEGLKEMFDAYNPTRARIAVRSLPPYIIRRIKLRGEQRRGRGFGFVSFANAEDQSRAIEEMNGKQVGDLTLVVKSAVFREDKQNDENEKNENEPIEASESAPTNVSDSTEPKASEVDSEEKSGVTASAITA